MAREPTTTANGSGWPEETIAAFAPVARDPDRVIVACSTGSQKAEVDEQQAGRLSEDDGHRSHARSL